MDARTLPRNNRLVRLALTANAKAISEITDDGDVAVVAFEAVGDAAEFAIHLGWDTISPVFRLSESARREFAAGADPVTSAWLTRVSTTPRVLLFTKRWSVLLNGDADGGWSPESNELDVKGRAMARDSRLTADELQRRVEDIRHKLRMLMTELVQQVSDEGPCPDTSRLIEHEDEILGHVGLQAALECLPERIIIGDRDNFAEALDPAEVQRARQAERHGN